MKDFFTLQNVTWVYRYHVIDANIQSQNNIVFKWNQNMFLNIWSYPKFLLFILCNMTKCCHTVAEHNFQRLWSFQIVNISMKICNQHPIDASAYSADGGLQRNRCKLNVYKRILTLFLNKSMPQSLYKADLINQTLVGHFGDIIGSVIVELIQDSFWIQVKYCS